MGRGPSVDDPRPQGDSGSGERLEIIQVPDCRQGRGLLSGDKRMKIIPDKTIVTGFALALLVLIANTYASFRATGKIMESDRRVSHTREVLGELESTLSTMQDAETGQRGFLITGQDNYLDPYQKALDTIADHIGRLKSLSPHNPSRLEHIAALETAVNAKLAELKISIAVARSNGLDAARQTVLSGKGRDMMEQCRQIVAGMQANEQSILSERAQQSTASDRTTVVTFWIASVFAIASLGLIYVVTAKSFADRQRSEHTIREHREWLRVTLASIGDAVVATDIHGKVTFMNPIAESLTGWSQEDATGAPITEVFHIVNEYTRQIVVNPATRVLAEGVTVGLANHTVLMNRKGGETPIDDSGAPIKGPAGKLLGVVLVFRDVSERRRSELDRESILELEQAARREAEQAHAFGAELLIREQEARAQAERANRTKDEFLATVSHELRTPLNAVLGWARMLSTGSLDGAASARALETIERNARAQAQLIEDLLDVSRIISGKLRLEIQPVELKDVIHAAIDSIRPAADAKGIVIRDILDPAVGFVSGDQDRLQQVIWNLLSNAVKFTLKGGEVEIRLERLDSQVGVVVHDTGRGISPELLPYVFDRFRQGDGSLTRKYGGLGLGLAIVRHLAELHGGTVDVKSPGEGQGSTFTVRLPMLAVRNGEPAAAIAGAAQGSAEIASGDVPARLDGLRLLIVDDEADARELLSAMLTQCGAQIKSAACAKEALAAVEDWKPDLLVSDIEMPHEDGYSLIGRLRASVGDLNQLPVIALTAHARTDDRLRALSAGFDAHVAKPVEFGELVAVIASLARRTVDDMK
jgi:PAS domain S-box-containing protein